MYRMAFPIIMMLMPRFIPNIIRFVTLVWRLTFDKRVPLILRALVPAALLYALLPFDLLKDSLPILGRADDLIFLGLALLLLVKMSPPQVVAEHMGNTPADEPTQEKDSSKVIEGRSRLIEED